MFDWQQFASGYGDQNVIHGQQGIEDVAHLRRALEAGNGQAVPNQAVPGSLTPLMPESLDGTLASLTFDQEDFPMWKAIPKKDAKNTAEEFNQLMRVSSGESAYIGEGDLPEEESSTYRRRISLVKFMGVTRRVTHVASLVNTAGVQNAIAAETRSGTLFLMRNLEQGLFNGDSTLVPEQFDGIKKQIIDGDGLVYDLRGAPLTQEIVNGMTAAIRKAPYYGRTTHLYTTVGVRSDLANTVLANLRATFGDSVTTGTVINEMQTQSGKIKIVEDVFLDESRPPYANGMGNANKRPLPPVVGALTSPVDAAGKFAAADAGTYIYKIVAANRYGRSAPVETAGIAVAQGDRVDIPVTDGGQGTSYYIVYRTQKDAAGSTATEVFKVARTGASQTIADLNAYLPDTSDVYGMEMLEETIQWRKLAPFTKIPLATVDTSIRWMQILYGTVQVRRPTHLFLLINVGRDPNSPFIENNIPGFQINV